MRCAVAFKIPAKVNNSSNLRLVVTKVSHSTAFPSKGQAEPELWVIVIYHFTLFLQSSRSLFDVLIIDSRTKLLNTSTRFPVLRVFSLSRKGTQRPGFESWLRNPWSLTTPACRRTTRTPPPPTELYQSCLWTAQGGSSSLHSYWNKQSSAF